MRRTKPLGRQQKSLLDVARGCHADDTRTLFLAPMILRTGNQPEGPFHYGFTTDEGPSEPFCPQCSHAPDVRALRASCKAESGFLDKLFASGR